MIGMAGRATWGEELKMEGREDRYLHLFSVASLLPLRVVPQ